MSVFVKIAWRNVRRNTRRSLLTVFIAGFGLATLVVSNALYDGFHEKMITNAVQLFMGHIQVHSRGFHSNPTIDKYLPADMANDVPQNSHVVAFAARVKFQALASTVSDSQAVLVVGIEPEKEKAVTTVAKSIVEGSYLDSSGDQNRCLVGEQLFVNLHLRLDEKLVLMSQGYDGSIAADAFRVTGVCRTGNPDVDRSLVWIPIRAAQKMLVYEGKISELVFLLDGSDCVINVQKFLKQHWSSGKVEILNWKEIAPDIFQLVELDRAMQTILMIVVSIIAAVAIMDAMLMAIQERFTEFGIISALGTKPGQIVHMVLWESFFLGLLGLVAGAVMAALVFCYLFYHGVNLASFAAGVAKFIGLSTTVYPVLRVKQMIVSSLVVLASSTLVSLFPALKAATMNTVQAIRHI